LGSQLSLIATLQYLPVFRCYQRLEDIGRDFYKHQCYFLTHLIYVFSDWGEHTLNRQLFAEEFDFIIRNMVIAIRLKDSEIVGEFLQCLKILQVCVHAFVCL